MNKKILVVLISILTFAGLLIGLSSCDNNTTNGKKNVVTTAWFSYDIAKQLSGDKFNVEMAYNYKTSLHHLVPTAETYAKIHDADLLILTSNLMDVSLLGPNADKSKLISQDKMVNLYSAIFPNKENPFEHHEEEDEHDHEHGHEHSHEHEHSHSSSVYSHEDVAAAEEGENGEDDRLEEIEEHSFFHYWTSIANMIKVTNVISDRLITLDETAKDTVLANKKALVDNMQAVIDSFKKYLEGKTVKPILYVGHDAMGAFMLEFNLANNYYPYDLNIDDNNEATAEMKADFIEMIKKSNVNVIYQPEMHEKQKTVDSILNEINSQREDKVRALVLNGMHNISEDTFNKLHYIDIVNQNIENLKQLIK